MTGPSAAGMAEPLLAAVVVASNRAAAGVYEDATGPLIVEALRGAGLSGAKARSIHDLAAHVADGRVRLERMGRLSDEAVILELTQVWGIGTWTAQMFLMFTLRRLDVWPVGDLGVRAGWARAHGLTEVPGPAELEVLGEVFRPYRSVAAWYCWRAVDTRVPTL